MHHAPWLPFAMAELGVRAFAPGASNPRITEYHEGTNIAGYDDKASWCSSFVNWSLGKAGIKETSSALARSWLTWGEPLEEPIVGCVTVLWREDPGSWKGHVGFFQRIEGDTFFLLGGNQLEEVRVHTYPLSTVLAHRWPTNALYPLSRGDKLQKAALSASPRTLNLNPKCPPYPTRFLLQPLPF